MQKISATMPAGGEQRGWGDTSQSIAIFIGSATFGLVQQRRTLQSLANMRGEGGDTKDQQHNTCPLVPDPLRPSCTRSHLTSASGPFCLRAPPPSSPTSAAGPGRCTCPDHPYMCVSAPLSLLRSLLSITSTSPMPLPPFLPDICLSPNKVYLSGPSTLSSACAHHCALWLPLPCVVQ